MQTGHKIAIAVVAVALIIVIGLIALTANTDKMIETNANDEIVNQTTNEPTAEPTETPAQEGSPDEEAQDEAQSDEDMYEGALAGLSEEEIGKLAMAEEQGHSEDIDGQEDDEVSDGIDGVVD